MLFSGYSCSADPFSRYLAGQSVIVCWDQKFSQVFHKLYKVQLKLTELVQDPTWTGAKKALAGCIELEQCFQCYLVVGAVRGTRSRDIQSESFPHAKFFRLEQFTSKFLKNGVENFEKQLWLAVQSSSSAFNVIQRVQLFGGPVLEIFGWTVCICVLGPEIFTSISQTLQSPTQAYRARTRPDMDGRQNSFGWLYRA